MVEFVNYTPVDKSLVTACNGGAPIPADVLQLDFSEGYENSRWNSTILERLYQKLLALCAEDNSWDLPDVSEGYFKGLLHLQLKQLHEV